VDILALFPPILPGEKLGIDLSKHHVDVTKMFYAFFGRRCRAAGYDVEDVLQEVYKGILARNVGKCPFDARKSSLGHYIHMVCSGVTANYHRQQSRRAGRESVGVMDYDDDDTWSNVDVASADIDDGSVGIEDRLVLRDEIDERLEAVWEHAEDEREGFGDVAVDVATLGVEGLYMKDVADRLGVERRDVSEARAVIRRVSG